MLVGLSPGGEIERRLGGGKASPWLEKGGVLLLMLEVFVLYINGGGIFVFLKHCNGVGGRWKSSTGLRRRLSISSLF